MKLNWPIPLAPRGLRIALRAAGVLRAMTRSDYGRAYQAGFKPTVRFLESKGAPHDAAEETAQAAWTRGWERIDQLRNEESLRTWVNAIALNMYRRAARNDRRIQPLLDRSGGADVDIAAIDLKNLLKCCCSSDRVLLLHQLNGLTTSEMAREVGASETAVRIRLMRARRSARSMTQPRRASRAAFREHSVASADSRRPVSVA
jgi:RNA polymerase sigma-70 factor (ECF subfamily)